MKTFALILADGQASRMGGEDKGLALLGGKALIDHVIDRVRPQVSHIAISTNRNLEEYARRSPHIFLDARQWQHFGPLSALCTAANDLQLATADWLLVVPCDMPYLPGDLVARFETVSKRTPLCNAYYVETPITMHYNIMYIRPQILQSAIPYLFSGMKTLRSWLQQQRARSVRFEFDGHFADLNTQTEKGKVKPYRAVFARIGGIMLSEGISDGIFRGEMLQFAPFLPTQGNRIMFTGIVQGLGKLTAIHRPSEAFHTYVVELPQEAADNLQRGASVANNGCCLTITEIEGNRVSFDLMAETLAKTNLGLLKEGDCVNIERAARFGDEIGGHVMSGHIMVTVSIVEIERDGFNRTVWVSLPHELKPYILTKGFVGLDGCSLTIGKVEDSRFNVHLIPETLERTLFGSRKVGDRINIEIDPNTQAIVDTLERLMAQRYAK